MLNSELVPTRTALLELRDESGAIAEAYDFLDEKRLMLAAELIRQVEEYRLLLEKFAAENLCAREAARQTVFRHGLRASKIYPAVDLSQSRLVVLQRNFMGVLLQSSSLQIGEIEVAVTPCNASPEAKNCALVFQGLLLLSGQMAAVSGNIQRLLTEYKRTQRRARALENVVIPELKRDLQAMTVQLEESDQEDVVRVHMR